MNGIFGVELNAHLTGRNTDGWGKGTERSTKDFARYRKLSCRPACFLQDTVDRPPLLELLVNLSRDSLSANELLPFRDLDLFNPSQQGLSGHDMVDAGLYGANLIEE